VASSLLVVLVSSPRYGAERSLGARAAKQYRWKCAGNVLVAHLFVGLNQCQRLLLLQQNSLLQQQNLLRQMTV
jgi:hypothetical protein